MRRPEAAGAAPLCHTPAGSGGGGDAQHGAAGPSPLVCIAAADGGGDRSARHGAAGPALRNRHATADDGSGESARDGSAAFPLLFTPLRPAEAAGAGDMDRRARPTGATVPADGGGGRGARQGAANSRPAAVSRRRR